MVFDVLADNFYRGTAGGQDEVAAVLEVGFPIVGRELRWELLSDVTGGDGLQAVNRVRQIHLRRCLEQEMDVVRFPVQFNQLAPPLIKQRPGDDFNPVLHWLGDAGMPVFRSQNQMITE